MAHKYGFVIRSNKGYGYYAVRNTWRVGKTGWTEDIQKARVFMRRCDASNSLGGMNEIVPVRLVEVVGNEGA